MDNKVNLLTQEGYDALVAELEELKVVRRKEVADKIAVARAQGDLSENAEHDEAKDEQAAIEARIEQIEAIMKNAEIIAVDEKGKKSKVNVGSTVKLLDVEYNEELVYKLVGSIESNSLKGKISNESPLGKAITGRKKGETVEVTLDSGEVIEYKILDIE